MREQRIALEHRVEGTAERRDIGDVLSLHNQLSFVGGVEAGDETERSGLAAARGAEEGYELSALDLKIDIIQDLLVTE